MSRRIAAVCVACMRFSRHPFALYVIVGFALLACLPTAASGQNSCPAVGLNMNPGKFPTCQVSCAGDTYDVNNNATDGCESGVGGLVGHDQTTAVSAALVGPLPSLTCTGQNNVHAYLASDARVHANPAIQNFNATVGAAPQWWSIVADPTASCPATLWASLTGVGTTHQSCYQLTVVTDNFPINSANNSRVTTAGGIINLGSTSTPAYSPGSTIYFKIEKVCSLASDGPENTPYTVLFSRTQPPSTYTPPTSVTVTYAVSGITASWSAVNTVGGQPPYNLKTSTNDTGPYTVVQSGINGNTATVTGLTPNTTYYVVVSAGSGSQESNNSVPVAVLTPPAVPTSVSQIGGGAGSIYITWLSSPGATSYLLNLGGVNFTTTAAAANCAPNVRSMCIYGAGGFPSGTQTGCSVAAVNASGGQSAFSGAVFCAAP